MSAAPTSSPSSARPPRASTKVWFFRAFTALVIPVFALLLLEGGLRLAGFGHSADFFIPDKKTGHLRTNPDYVSLFLPGSFDLRQLNYRIAEKKPANTVRIVVLGESAAQGIPAPAFAFAPQLRAQLRARYPEKTIEVINTGVVAINSHVVYQIAKNAARYEPDLFVVYLGNNEVVGPYGPGCSYLSSMRPRRAIRLTAWLQGLRLGQLVAFVVEKAAALKDAPRPWGGMAMFMDHAVRGDDPRLRAVEANFEANLRDIVDLATDAGAKTLLCTGVSNLKDSPPFLSLHRADLTAADLKVWQQAFDEGRLAWRLGESAIAQTRLNEAWRIDPQYADTAFMLGDLDLRAGAVDAARKWFLEAQRWDALRFRPDPRLNEIVRAVAAENPSVTLVDSARQLGSDPGSTGPLAGRELLFEHVHFDWEGNHRLARLMAEGVAAALFKDVPDRQPWLDSAGCATALGYTPLERFGVLQRAALITRYAPFPNQLTYATDQARDAREMAAAEAVRRDPAALPRAREAVQAATRNDPDNPDLANLAVELSDEQEDLVGALDLVHRAQALQPENLGLLAEEAVRLGRLGRNAEAEQLLLATARTASPRDRPKLTAVFADFYFRTKRLADGQRWFDQAIIHQSDSAPLRLFRAKFALAAGELTLAENDFRVALKADPASDAALEGLMAMLAKEGRTKEFEEFSLRHLADQPGNQANQLRAAHIFEERGRPIEAVLALQSAIGSGPAPVAVRLRLANLLYGLQRRSEAVDQLATAWRLAQDEGDRETADSIRELIRRMQAGAGRR